jgi:hypothetical protein
MGVVCFSLKTKTGEFTWSKLMGAADLSVSDADLDLLDAYLLSDQSPPECSQGPGAVRGHFRGSFAKVPRLKLYLAF